MKPYAHRQSEMLVSLVQSMEFSSASAGRGALRRLHRGVVGNNLPAA